ncbi:hypothetical protein [Amycolatopsis sp. lyj-84]|uniref:hypothetical protein n=1 Tax=Amycolatopsis sp. lyj-84 TaxID=2789284 RepID=UPI00397BE39A
MAVRVIRDENPDGYAVTSDKSDGGRYSVYGPLNRVGTYEAWDGHQGESLGKGSREEMIELVESLPGDGVMPRYSWEK